MVKKQQRWVPEKSRRRPI